MYKLVLKWDHDPEEPIVDRNMPDRWNLPGWFNSKMDGGLCDPSTANQFLAPDGLPYWLPRFYPRPVPQEVTELTGIKF